jgi:hypothetical protein
MDGDKEVAELICLAVRELRFSEFLLLRQLRNADRNSQLVDVLVENHLEGLHRLRVLLLRHQRGQSTLMERFDLLFFQLQLDLLLVDKDLSRSATQ